MLLFGVFIALLVEGIGQSTDFHADIEAVMDVKSIGQNNFSSNKSFQTINPL